MIKISKTTEVICLIVLLFIFLFSLVSSDENFTNETSLGFNEINENLSLELNNSINDLLNETINETLLGNLSLSEGNNSLEQTFNETNEANETLVNETSFIFRILDFPFKILAETTNYFVSMFTFSLHGGKAESSNYEAVVLLNPQASTRNAESEAFTANIGFFEAPINALVSITSYSIYPKSAVSGSIIRLAISALNSQSVWVVLTLPNNTQETLALVNNENTYYTVGLVGRYNLIFYANSSTGTIASAVDYFDIVESVISNPPNSPSGGGGGTTIIEKNCTYIWDCSAWSICSKDKKQIRVCKNIGTCDGEQGKPKEEMNCSEALFDIITKFEKVEFGKNDTLKFAINLIETKGIEKIDVNIRYSIINSNNTEVFSQTETRAIMGNLTYEKEISEIKLIDGEYTLRVDLIYGDMQKAFAEQRFKVRGDKLEVQKEFYFTSLFNFFNYKILILILLICCLILIFLKRRSLFKRKVKPLKNCIRSLIGKEVHSENGNKVGKVKEVYISKHKIYGLLIKPFGKTKNIMLKYDFVRFVGGVVIVHGSVDEILSKSKDL